MTAVLPRPAVAAPRRRHARWRARLTLTVVALWTLGVLAQRLLSGRWWPVLFVDLLPPIAYAVVPPLLSLPAVFWVRRHRWWVVAVLAATLLVQVPRDGLNWSFAHSRPAPADGRITVFSWNTEYWHQTDPAAGFYDFLRSQQADVYLLQEYELADPAAATGVSDPGDLAALRAAFPGYQVVQRGELVTLSRFPVVASPGVAPDPGPAPGQGWDYLAIVTKALRVDVRTPAGVLSTYNVHLPVQLNQANPLTPAFYRNVRHADERRREALRGLRSDVAANPHPLLIAGDFNTTAAMGDLDTVRDVARPATQEAFYPYSWDVHTPLRLWRLDWLFTRGGLDSYDYHFGGVRGYSDHRAQHVTVVLR